MLNTKCKRIRQRHCKVIVEKHLMKMLKEVKLEKAVVSQSMPPVVAKTSGVVETNSISLTRSPYFLFIACSCLPYSVSWNGGVAVACTCVWMKKTLASKMKVKGCFATAYKPSSPHRSMRFICMIERDNTGLVPRPTNLGIRATVWGRDPIGVPPTSVPWSSVK